MSEQNTRAIKAQDFSYLAFISYSRKDEDFAAWLQKQLESYRLPASALKENPELPKQVRPIFRDKTDLASGTLSDTLNEAVLRSEKLILICSPHSAKSEWVNHEVEAFIAAGRYEHIIPVIVDGMPHSPNPAEECFPPALLEEHKTELLGIDVPSYGKQGTLIRVVAAVLGIRYDSLHRRHVKAQRKRRLYFAAIALAVLLAVAGIAFVIQAQARIPAFASNLSTQAVVLANRDPETAAYFALAAEALNPSDVSRDAMMVVAQNNRFAVSSSMVASTPLKQVASNGEIVLALASGTEVAVLQYPSLEPLGTLELEESGATISSRGANGFAVVDARQLKLYSGASNSVPVLEESFLLNFKRTGALYGPYTDSAGGVLVLSGQMEGVYWSPVTKKALFFDLLENDEARATYGDTTIVAASGFCSEFVADSQSTAARRTPFNGATSDVFCFATTNDYVMLLHLEVVEITTSPGDADVAPQQVWAERILRDSHGTYISALGWQGTSLLVGMDAGLARWESIGSGSARESAFPLAGITEPVLSIAEQHVRTTSAYGVVGGASGSNTATATNSEANDTGNADDAEGADDADTPGDTDNAADTGTTGGASSTVSTNTLMGTTERPVAILTESGVHLISGSSAIALNGVTAASSAVGPVTSLATILDGTWIAGRSNGAVIHLDSGAKPLATGAMDTEASAQGIAADGSLLVSSGLQQRAWGIQRYAISENQESEAAGYMLVRTADYLIPDKVLGANGIYLNAVAGDGEVVVACGKRQPQNGAGVVLVWTAPNTEPLVLDFPSGLNYAQQDGFDMVSSVAYSPATRTVAAFNVQSGTVALWSVDTGERLHTLELGENLTGAFPVGASRMSSSPDGSWLAVTLQGVVSIIEVATGEVSSTFAAPPTAYAVISPDASLLVVVDLHRVSIVNRQGVEQGLLFTPTEDSLVTAAWAPEGATIAIADGRSREILFFDAATAKQRGLPWASPSGLTPIRLEWTPDGTHLMVSNGFWNGNIYEVKGVDLLAPRSNTWVEQLKALASSGVSDEVWRDNGGQGITQPVF